jgi:hypothetical protein
MFASGSRTRQVGEASAAAGGIMGRMLCAMTGQPHRLFWMRSAWWCQDCRQKVESCCEGGGCPSVVDVLPVAGQTTGRAGGARP